MERTELTNREILIEMQKEVERLMLENKEWCRHPYCLSLDLYNTTWSNLLSQGIVIAREKCADVYHIDRAKLTYLINMLRELPLRHPVGSYADALPSIISISMDMRAKI